MGVRIFYYNMRIDEKFYINNVSNIQKYNSSTKELQIFARKDSEVQNTFPSYFSSPKYLELKNMVEKYDLSTNYVLKSEKLNYAANCRRNFISEFGTIKSGSMQQLVLNPLAPNLDSTLTDNINKMRKECREEGNYTKSLKARMKERKIGNCTDIALVTADNINQKQNQYKAELLYASILSDDVICNHVAVLVKDKNENNNVSANSIVLDNWLGGVFKYSDWVKIVKHLYNSNNVSTYVEEADK